MTLLRPEDGFKGQMTTPPTAWPTTDEDAHSHQAGDLSRLLLNVNSAVDSWGRTLTFAFDGRTWTGQAADAGKNELQRAMDLMQTVAQALGTAIRFHRNVSETVMNVKHQIIAICNSADDVIHHLNSMPVATVNQSRREDVIKAIVSQALLANEAIVTAAGVAITAGQVVPPMSDERIPDFGRNVPVLADSLHRVLADNSGRPPRPAVPNTNVSDSGQQVSVRPASGPSTRDTERNMSAREVGQNQHTVPSIQIVANNNKAVTTRQPNPSSRGWNTPISPNSTILSVGAAPGLPSTSAGGSPSVTSPGPGAPDSEASIPQSQSDIRQTKDEATEAKTAQNQGAAPSGLSERVPVEQLAKTLAAASQPAMLPAAAGAPPLAPVTVPSHSETAAPSHQADSPKVSFGSPHVSAPPMPLGPPATPPPAGSVAPAPANTNTPGVTSTSANKNDAAGTAPIPVSAARRERDAALSASTAGALRRQRGNTTLIRARRIAAALNMGAPVYGFFWVTGLVADGSIVVANSYGLGYIPEGVELPERVAMASADESIAPTERAPWATYPMLALQGWAQARDQKLRAVIATAEQFASFDPGVPRVILQHEDIPQSGRLVGRSRLEVIAPDVAGRLAATADGALQELLPAAPVSPIGPGDKSAALWFELTKPLMSTASTRGVTHLAAFVAYADHAQELALHAAQTAPDPGAQRTAIADWIYWQHLGVLMSDAIGADAVG
jgi:ESX secretion-associated protein EspK